MLLADRVWDDEVEVEGWLALVDDEEDAVTEVEGVELVTAELLVENAVVEVDCFIEIKTPATNMMIMTTTATPIASVLVID